VYIRGKDKNRLIMVLKFQWECFSSIVKFFLMYYKSSTYFDHDVVNCIFYSVHVATIGDDVFF